MGWFILARSERRYNNAKAHFWHKDVDGNWSYCGVFTFDRLQFHDEKDIDTLYPRCKNCKRARQAAVALKKKLVQEGRMAQ